MCDEEPTHRKNKTNVAQRTCWMCVDADVDQRARGQAQAGDAVHGLHVEGVVGVHGEVQDGHGGAGQAQRPGDEAQVRSAGLALRGAAVARQAVAPLAQDVVGDVLPATRVAGGQPVQEQGRVVDQGHQVPGGGRRPCGRRGHEASLIFLWRWLIDCRKGDTAHKGGVNLWLTRVNKR